MKLLDTDILTLVAAGNARVVDHVRLEADVIATTIITRIEVLKGRFDALLKAADGAELQRAQEKLIDAEEQLAELMTIPIDAVAAAHFEELRKERKLKRIGRADLLIASIALAHRATLVTRNVRHFSQVSGLSIENWAD